MRKIVIPTDFSETSMNAIKYALALFKYDLCDFVVIHAFADEVYENTRDMDREGFEIYKGRFQKKVEKQLQEEVGAMLQTTANPRHKYRFEARFGSLVDETNDLIERDNSDIVVMGTRGKTGDKNVTFGSQTLQVIKYVKCPVLAVPLGFEGYPVKRMLFATDYRIPYQRRELKLLNVLGKNFGAQLTVVHFSEYEKRSHRQEDNRSFLECCLDKARTSYLKHASNAITGGINQLLQEQDFDMLVMVNHRHSYMEELLYHSTIEKIGLEIKIPFLVLQNLHR